MDKPNKSMVINLDTTKKSISDFGEILQSQIDSNEIAYEDAENALEELEEFLWSVMNKLYDKNSIPVKFVPQPYVSAAQEKHLLRLKRAEV